ncbi:protein asteroid isoform X1 [Hydra vulgaris]|uniref:protein asteroid isoform X1 n=1 Tax=Hydra vulgaris TaxID=6087 RepID=UPI001F5F2752|nr:protein asteroid-like [Hydra vulgaris]
MGIKQLTSYFELHHASLFTEILDLRGSKVVVDGDALLYCLLNSVSSRYGGEYNEMSRVFEHFFKELHLINVMPLVVLDGCINVSLKTCTTCERNKQRIKALGNINQSNKSHKNLPIPLFSKQVFIEVMQEMCIHFVVAPNEADMLIAVFANYLNCPVVSSDSDLYIVDVAQGVISMSNFMNVSNLNNVVSYNLQNLCQLLHLAKEKMPFLAVILGNDYSINSYLTLFQIKSGISDQQGNLIKVTPRLQKVAEYLNSISSRDDIIRSLVQDVGEMTADIKEHLIMILDNYDLSYYKLQASSLLPILLKQNSNPECQLKSYNSMGDYLKVMCSHGKVHSCVLNIYFDHVQFYHIQSENVSAKAATCISRDLVDIIYHLCSITDNVKEFQRAGLNYKEKLKVVDQTVNEKTNTSDQKSYMCQLGKFYFNESEAENTIMIISLRFWIIKANEYNCPVSIEHIKALVITYLSLKVENSHTWFNLNFKDFDVAVGHRFCEWQSVVFYLMIINCLLSFPLTSPKLSLIFCGKRAHSAYKFLISYENEDKLVNDAIGYMEFLKIVTDGLLHCIKITPQSLLKKKKKRK